MSPYAKATRNEDVLWSRGNAPHILNLNNKRNTPDSTPLPLRKTTLDAVAKRTKNSPVGNRTPVVQPIASHFTVKPSLLIIGPTTEVIFNKTGKRMNRKNRTAI
jgi:hypothetical protein